MKVGLSTKEKAKKYVKSRRIGIISHTSESGRIHWSKRVLAHRCGCRCSHERNRCHIPLGYWLELVSP